jgi:hypothetical protein
MCCNYKGERVSKVRIRFLANGTGTVAEFAQELIYL